MGEDADGKEDVCDFVPTVLGTVASWSITSRTGTIAVRYQGKVIRAVVGWRDLRDWETKGFGRLDVGKKVYCGRLEPWGDQGQAYAVDVHGPGVRMAVCQHFLAGTCRDGESCKFPHSLPESEKWDHDGYEVLAREEKLRSDRKERDDREKDKAAGVPPAPASRPAGTGSPVRSARPRATAQPFYPSGSAEHEVDPTIDDASVQEPLRFDPQSGIARSQTEFIKRYGVRDGLNLWEVSEVVTDDYPGQGAGGKRAFSNLEQLQTLAEVRQLFPGLDTSELEAMYPHLAQGGGGRGGRGGRGGGGTAVGFKTQ
eukprot:Hpha_TRINITY_DN34976_c0_g1::TRINITY_DN34976_c0_g1_i1::g.184159::m.184159